MKIQSKIMKNGDTIYFFERSFHAPTYLVVSKDAPPEAHQHAQGMLLAHYNTTTMKYKAKRLLRSAGLWLIKQS